MIRLSRCVLILSLLPSLALAMEPVKAIVLEDRIVDGKRVMEAQLPAGDALEGDTVVVDAQGSFAIRLGGSFEATIEPGTSPRFVLRTADGRERAVRLVESDDVKRFRALNPDGDIRDLLNDAGEKSGDIRDLLADGGENGDIRDLMNESGGAGGDIRDLLNDAGEKNGDIRDLLHEGGSGNGDIRDLLRGGGGPKDSVGAVRPDGDIRDLLREGGAPVEIRDLLNK